MVSTSTPKQSENELSNEQASILTEEGSSQDKQVPSVKGTKKDARKQKVRSVAPEDVLKAVKRHFNGHQDVAMRQIAMSIKEGSLRIRALRWVSKSAPSQKIWNAGPPTARKRETVRPGAFAASHSWDRDAIHWDWKLRRFFIKHKSDQKWLLMKDVSFHEGDVRNFIEALISESPGSGGRSPRIEAWCDMVIRVAEMARNGELTAESLSGQKAFNRALRAGLPADQDLGLSDEALKPFNAALRAHFKPLIDAESGDTSGPETT